MARIRSIKPDFWTDEKVVELQPLARLLFVGLWNFADDEGRMPYSPTRIKLQILPADSADVSVLLGEIRGKSLIEVYAVDGQEYLQVVHFSKHQKFDKRTPSRFPANPHIAQIHSELPRKTPTEVEVEVEVEVEGNGIKPSRASRSVPNGAFAAFWGAYPKKKSKGAAEKAWIKIKPDEQLQDRILSAVERAKTSADWTRDGGMFIPHPATWLNAKGWDDEEVSLAPELRRAVV